ncbi:MAG TPA: FecR family protein [Burkholderiales bacterium]|nr:FecR family protein [Burkholderiales bacterium]
MNTPTLRLKSVHSLAWLFLMLLPGSIALAAPVANISRTTGDVTVANAQAPAKSASNGMGIDNGATVTTGTNGQAVIKFRDGQIVALQSRSVFRVTDYQFNQAAPESGQSFLALLQGGARILTGLIGNRHSEGWKLALPTATVGIRGTDFLALIREGAAYFKVNTGSIAVTNGVGTGVFATGQKALAQNATTAAKVISDAELPSGLFSELEGMSLTGGLSGPASGAAGPAGPMIGPVPAWAVGLGVGAAAFGIMIADENDDDKTTTNH